MSEMLIPPYDIIIALICVGVTVFLIFFFIQCNYYGGVCPGKWAFMFVGNLIYNGVPSLFGKAIIAGIMKMADFIPV